MDVEDEIFANFIRRPREEVETEEKPVKYWVPLMLRDIGRLNISECYTNSKLFHAFNGQLPFRTVIVWARIISIVLEKQFYHNFMIDDMTHVMWVRVGKRVEDRSKSQMILNDIEHHKDDCDTQTYHDLRNVILGMDAMLDYGRFKQYQSVLIYGVPADFFGEIGIRAFAILTENELRCDSDDFELFYKEMLIKWYLENRPR